MIYKYQAEMGDAVQIYPSTFGGIVVTSRATLLPDDEIPNLISALQNYMSKRAKEITRAAANGR